ncbi:MAG: hypothetical protein QOH47_508 [Sphingomonadales bacterium]|nr:hypothetical protein [Sphingomonadales bacterium]
MNATGEKQEMLGRSATTLADASKELASLVPILRRLAESESLRNIAQGHSFEITSASVRSVITARRLRDEYFWPAMSENAWSLLLELFASRLDGRHLDIAGLSAATQLSTDSALHWIDWIAARGLVSRKYAEGDDARVDLTDAGADRMRAYLLASLSLSPWVQ